MQEPLFRVSFDAAGLLRDHPPKLRHANKIALFGLACPPGSDVRGTIEVTRWRADIDDELGLRQRAESTVEPNFYNYPASPAGTLAWHVNFADPHLFVAYGSGLFAQDEMQVAEHPLLGSVREALLAANLAALTRDEHGGSPILVRGVERRIEVQTNADCEAGRPFGLYGIVLVPPTLTRFGVQHGRSCGRRSATLSPSPHLGMAVASIKQARSNTSWRRPSPRTPRHATRRYEPLAPLPRQRFTLAFGAAVRLEATAA